MSSTPVGFQQHDSGGRTVGGSVEQPEGSASKSGASAKGTSVGASPSATPQGNAQSIGNEKFNSAGSSDEDDPEEIASAKSELGRYAPRAPGTIPAARYKKKKTRKTPPAGQTPQGQQTPQPAGGHSAGQTPQGQQTPQPAGGQKSPASGSKKRPPPATTASSSTTKGS